MERTNYFKANLSNLLEFYNITTSQLARKLNISEEKIKTWLNATSLPTYPQLTKLADCFKRPIIFFFMETPPMQSFEIDFRTSQEYKDVDDKKRLSELIDSISIYKASLKDLFDGEPQVCQLHDWINYADRQNFYEYLRNQLNFSIKLQCQFKRPTDVIEYLREQFYHCGIYIFKDSFRIDQVSGLCAYDEKFPIILINNKVSFTRQLFTIFHELYHLLSKAFHIDILSVSEKDCDKFAGEFLIPKKNLLEDIEFCHKEYKIDSCENYEFITDRANHYNISREAYLFQLLQLNEIREEYFNDFRQENLQYLIRSRQDDIAGGNYYFTKMNYLGKAYLNDIVAGYFSGRFPLRYIAQFTQMKVPNVKKMLTMMSGGRY